MTSLAHDSPELAETYDRLSDSQFESGQRLFERLGVRSGDRVLDVGCGTGRLTRWIAAKLEPDGAAVGIDPLVDRIAIARARSARASFEVGRAEDLSAFSNESFDAVCLSAVFHWVPDKAKALAEVRRVLRPGGRMGLTTLPRELHLAGTVARVCGPVFGRSPYRERLDPETLAARVNGPTLTEIVQMIIESSSISSNSTPANALGGTRAGRTPSTSSSRVRSAICSESCRRICGRRSAPTSPRPSTPSRTAANEKKGKPGQPFRRR
jgi:arsenite methyltransferase